MAVRTVSVLGGNWNATTAWVGGVVPSATLDTVAFTATSGNLTVNVASTCIGIDFTNYVNTVTFASILTVTGPVNLGTGGYTQAGANGITVNTTATHTNGGVTWSRLWTFAGASQTHTLSGTWTFTGTLNFSPTTAMTLTGSTINTANLTVTTASTISGTTAIIFNGTGTWSHSAAGTIRNNVTINTAGTLTIGTNIYYNTGTLLYTTGTVNTTTNSSILNINASATLSTGIISWSSLIISAATTITLGANLKVSSTFTMTTGGYAVTITPGVFSVDFSTANVNIGNSNAGATTFTYNGTITCVNFTVVAGNGTSGTLNGTTYNITRNFTITTFGTGGSVAGTSTINLTGTGTVQQTNSGIYAVPVTNNFTINTSGTITFLSGTRFFYQTGIFTYTAGTVIIKNSTLNLTAACTLINCHKINFDRVVITSSVTITMNEFFSGSPNLKTTISPSTTTNYTITFLDGFEKISKFVNISGCTLTKPQQLLVITNSKKNSTNTRGIRYINQSPNGIAKDNPSTLTQVTYNTSMLLNDPAMR